MCIIVYKKAGIKFPKEEILRKCFDNNEDGAGFMYAKNGKVFISKGYMDFDSFYKALKNTIFVNGDKIPYVLHFRISTQAGIRKDCTHPFPLSEDTFDLKKLKIKTDIGIAHNGIIYLTSERSETELNDTMKFIKEYLTLIIKDKNYYRDKKTIKLIEKLTDSKLAILDGTGHCELIGDDWIYDNGIYYSNNSYKYAYTYTGYYLCPEKDLEYEKYYDNELGLYNFNPYTCPLMSDNPEYCECCINYPCCNGIEDWGA